MPRKPQPSLEARTYAALEELGQATADQILVRVGISNRNRQLRGQVYRTLWELVDNGRAGVLYGHLAAGFFFIPEKPAGGGLQAKLRRAAGLRCRKYGGFTANDLTALALARDRDYTKKLLRWWWDLGLLVFKEVRRGEPVYALAPAVNAEQLPHWSRRAEERKRPAASRQPSGQQTVQQVMAEVRQTVETARSRVGRALGESFQEVIGMFEKALNAPLGILAEMDADLEKIAEDRKPKTENRN